VRLKDWRWNREQGKWELVETGEEFTAGDAVVLAPVPGVLALAAAGAVIVWRLIARLLRRRQTPRKTPVS
jgi:hypothetical protein